MRAEAFADVRNGDCFREGSPHQRLDGDEPGRRLTGSIQDRTIGRDIDPIRSARSGQGWPIESTQMQAKLTAIQETGKP